MNSNCVNFVVSQDDKAQHKLPRWLTKSIEWARDAREESLSGLKVTVKPPQEALSIDLQSLHTLFLLSYGIEILDPESGDEHGRPHKHTYTSSLEGFESRFYILDPSQAQILQCWNIPPYVWAVREEILRLLEPSETWAVDVKFMAAIGKEKSRNKNSLLVRAPTARHERTHFSR